MFKDPYLQDCGDGHGFCRYYPDRCPFGPACLYIKNKPKPKPVIQQLIPKPVAVVEKPIVVKSPTIESPYKPVKREPVNKPMIINRNGRGRVAKYGWEKIEPIMLEMRNAGESFGNIALATGIPEHSLVSRWHGKKMQAKCTRTNFRAARYDWDAVLPIMQEMRNKGDSWDLISQKTGISRNALQNKWKSLGMVIEEPAGGAEMNIAHKILNKMSSLICGTSENTVDIAPVAIIPQFIPLNRKGFKGKVVDWEKYHEFIFRSLYDGKGKKWIANAIGVDRTDIRRYVARYENTQKAGGN